MKMSREDFLKKLSDALPEDNGVELLEDFADSFPEDENNSELETLRAEHEALKTKYRERFYSSGEKKEEEEDKEENKIIDIKEI